MSYTQGTFPAYTPHDFSHGLNVEENLNWLLPEKTKEEINPYEIFFLLVSAFMHDWGMVSKPGEDAEEIRLNHHKRTEKNFEEMHEKLFLSEHEARIIGRISRGHTKEDLSTPDYDDEVFGANTRIRKRFLSAVLRIADECDVTCNRTPETIYYSINPTAKSDEEFKKHLSISGVGQLNEKHKIYISAIARDPKGAKTLRLVKEKIQGEIDGVKSILANNGMILDSVELRMETRGFIDKPIGFEIAKKKIVELLIGEHLYESHDAAIRELVQNGIDACKAKNLLDGKKDCKVTIFRTDENTICISDNGIGMDYLTAKEFLSVIGASYYSSEEFNKLLSERSLTSIAMFGIGLLSSFLIADGLTIETKKDGFDPCKFTIGPLEEDWKYQKGTFSTSGTLITLQLNESGKKIVLEKALKKYFAAPEVDLYYRDIQGDMTKFVSIWTAKELLSRFSHKTSSFSGVKEVIKLEFEQFDVILARSYPSSESAVFLFNHGIFVGQADLSGFNALSFTIFVNIRENLIDIHLSREKPVFNKKWNMFIAGLFDVIFDGIYKQVNDPKQYILSIGPLLESRCWLQPADVNSLENTPFIKSFFDNALFPVVCKGVETSYSKFSELPKDKGIIVYSTHSKHPLDEISLLTDLLKDGQVAITNPYSFPIIVDQKSVIDRNLFNYMFTEKEIVRADLTTILLKNIISLKTQYLDIIPSNVQLVNFPEKWKPIVIIKKPAIVEKSSYLGSSYWGNILLWKELFLNAETSKILETSGFMGRHIESVKMQSKQVVCVDAQDEFVRGILQKRAQKSFDALLSRKIQRYFMYLSFLPLVLSNLSSTVIFLDVLDNLEEEISMDLGITRKNGIMQRFKPTFVMYAEYYERCDIEKIYLETPVNNVGVSKFFEKNNAT